jgi:hypothetical protein
MKYKIHAINMKPCFKITKLIKKHRLRASFIIQTNMIIDFLPIIFLRCLAVALVVSIDLAREM